MPPRSLRRRAHAHRAGAHPNDWYRITLGFEVNPRNAQAYGRLEASVDDSGVVVSTDLSVPLFDGSVVFNAGITQGDVGHRSGGG